MESFSVGKILENVVTYLKSTELLAGFMQVMAPCTGLAVASWPQPREAFDT